ncbi:MAG: tRNA (adenosine(37)-N6)-dimethylallyltransferase MiaA [bacterium]
MNKLLCIVGPTGTGKTKKAIELSKEQPSILVSADSRQVYRGMDIVTGKDHPPGTKIYGIDLVSPSDPCSVSVWDDAVFPHLTQAWAEGKLPIVVGGTGLYVKALTEGIFTMQVPINQPLRDELETLSIIELQQKLNQLDEHKFASLNHSDSMNPRRLIRAIEVAMFAPSSPMVNPQVESEIIGLRYADSSTYHAKVTQRVLSRLKAGAIEETENLLTRYDKNIQSMSAIGYTSIIKYLENTITKEELIKQWVAGELSYAKRQMTWFRKQSVIWYDVDNNN